MDALRVVYKEEYDKGYVCNPRIQEDKIIFDTKYFDLVRKINDKEYIVKDPNGY